MFPAWQWHYEVLFEGIWYRQDGIYTTFLACMDAAIAAGVRPYRIKKEPRPARTAAL